MRRAEEARRLQEEIARERELQEQERERERRAEEEAREMREREAQKEAAKEEGALVGLFLCVVHRMRTRGALCAT